MKLSVGRNRGVDRPVELDRVNDSQRIVWISLEVMFHLAEGQEDLSPLGISRDVSG